MTTKRLTPHRTQIIVCVVSALIGTWFLTPKIIWPLSTQWLSWGDMRFAQHMWEYFRYTPLLQWPLTAVDQFGEGWGTIFPSTAGIVLFGLPLKYLSPVLPSDFQYLGVWTLLNFVLQGYFSEKLFYRFGLSELERILGSISIVLAPVFIFRIGMTHLDLSAHWVILAALHLYFKPLKRYRYSGWLALVLIVALIHMYLFVIVFSVAIAAIVRNVMLSDAEERFRMLLRHVGFITLFSLFVLWVVGYFAFSGATRGVGFFRLNMFAFLNPGYGRIDSFSSFLESLTLFSTRQFIAEEGEGFGYLGLVGLLGLVALLLNIGSWIRYLRHSEYIPLLIVSTVLLLLAISHRPAFVRSELEIPIPQSLIDARQVFRVANRFSWLAYYLLLIVGWIAVTRLLNSKRFPRVLLILVLVVGQLDQWRGVMAVREKLVSPTLDVGVFSTPEWNQIGQDSTRMYLIPTFDVQDDALPSGAEVWLEDPVWPDFIQFGSRHQLTTNFAYVGRPVTKQVARSNSEIRQLIREKNVPTGSILFFADVKEWQAAQIRLGNRVVGRHIDGLNVLIVGR